MVPMVLALHAAGPSVTTTNIYGPAYLRSGPWSQRQEKSWGPPGMA